MLKKNGIFIALVILVVALALIQIFSGTEHRSERTTAGIPGAYIPNEDTLMTYRDFKMFEDSIKQINEWKDVKNNGRFRGGVETSFIGVASINDCDNCGLHEKSSLNKYYLVLPGYALYDRDNRSFYVDSDKNYIQFTWWDQDIVRKGKVKGRLGHYESRQVPFRFSTDKENRNGQVLVPIERKSYSILYPLIISAIILLMIFMFYVIIVLPAIVLIRISTGRVFIPANIRQLNFIAGTLICCPFVNILVRFILKLSFQGYITSDVDFLWLQLLYQYKFTFIAGIVVLIIALAFKRGYNLQKEQDLTI